MLRLSGTKLPCLPIFNLTWTADLEYFEGPLVSHITNGRGSDYIKYWADIENDINRWMIARVSVDSIARLMDRVESLDNVLPARCQDDFVYFVDASPSVPLDVQLVMLEQIPQEYLPDRDAFLRPSAKSRRAGL